jgi:type IV pilus assembly protein PilV
MAAMTMMKKQQGAFLLEALIAILIFSFGILGLVGMQSKAISAQSDAQYRIEAANFADKMMGQIWLGIDRTSDATFANSLKQFQHQPNTTGICNFSGTASANADVSSWVDDQINGDPPRKMPLPGAKTSMQQITVNTNFSNMVTITVCWQAPFDAAPRRFSMVSYIN